ncbi:MAG: hypothetical protein ACKOW2_08660, partial [Sphingobacteriaceae bacterium]
MKIFYTIQKIILGLLLILISQAVWAQIPQQLNYQGALRDDKGNPIINEPISVRLSIQDAGPNGKVHYSEERQVTTNGVGLYAIAIGSAGANTVGVFADI